MIDIQDIIPFMCDGWVAMSNGGDWFWAENEPKISTYCGCWNCYGETADLNCFDIAPADDWTKSLIKVGGK